MKTIIYETHAGDSIHYVAEKSIKLCQDKLCNVKFDFNGIVIVVTQDDICSADIVKRYRNLCEQRRVANEESPEGVAAQLRREAELLQKQSKMDNIMEDLGNITTVYGLLSWLTEFVPVADYCGVVYDKTKVLDVLEAFGFKRNECVGGDMSDIDQRIKWLFGQVIDGIRTVGCPHPMMAKFASELIDDLEGW